MTTTTSSYFAESGITSAYFGESGTTRAYFAPSGTNTNYFEILIIEFYSPSNASDEIVTSDGKSWIVYADA